jgi:hypothetical protein
MKRTVACLALAALTAPCAVAAGAVRVTVNDRPLEVAPIVSHQRVLVPMRAIFQALGARVGYDAKMHVVSAIDGSHAVKFQIGDRTALVDDRVVLLDVPARIVGASTYVPLRFVAQSLGAVVGYDDATALVTVSLRATVAARAFSGTSQPVVTALEPADNAGIATGYPTISAVVRTPDGTAARNAHLYVDGIDVTAYSAFDGTTVTYLPRTSLSVGTHTVDFGGDTQNGQPFDAQWSFQTTLDLAYQDSYDNPYGSFGTALQFYLDGAGSYGPGDWMRFILIAPPGGNAYLSLCTSPYRYWMWNGGSGTFYQATVRAPYGYSITSCPVEAVFVGWNGQAYYLPYPVFVSINTPPTPRPTPTPGLRHTEPIGHRPPVEGPSPSPGPIMHGVPIVPHPDPTSSPPHVVRTPHAEPTPPPTPRPVTTPAPASTVSPPHIVHTPHPDKTDPPE